MELFLIEQIYVHYMGSAIITTLSLSFSVSLCAWSRPFAGLLYVNCIKCQSGTLCDRAAQIVHAIWTDECHRQCFSECRWAEVGEVKLMRFMNYSYCQNVLPVRDTLYSTCNTSLTVAVLVYDNFVNIWHCELVCRYH